MKTSITAIILFVEAALLCIGFGASAGSLGRQTYLLPWQVIVEKFCRGSQFCSGIGPYNNNGTQKTNNTNEAPDSNANYVFQPKQPITIRLPAQAAACSSLQKISINLAKWVESSWQQVGEVGATIESNEVKLSSGIEGEGFFRLRAALEVQDRWLCCFEAYAIVSDNWQRDILAFCRTLKEQIEINPDPQLIFSSIAVSHFDNAMEMVSPASFLSGEILQALEDAVQSEKTFKTDQCPDLVVGGLNKIRLKRFEGVQTAEFVVFVPENYDDSQEWPLFLHPDPRRLYAVNNYSEHSGLIDIWWHFPMPIGFEWKDYKHLRRILSRKLNIDEDRMYIDGICGNGISAMALALKHPDEWAECSAVTGNSCRHLIGNALNLPVIFGQYGYHESPDIVGYREFVVKCFKFYGCKNFKHTKLQSISTVRGAPVPDAVRQNNPQRVLYTIESLHNPKAYWVKIDGREDENLAATIDACVRGQTVLIETKNIDAYTLNLAQAPIDTDRPIEIIENRQSLGSVTGRIFARKSEKYINAAYIKNERLHGPVWDAFTDQYVVVWGDGSADKEFSEISRKIAQSLAKGGPCLADTDMAEELADSYNLILVGTTESNRWLSKIWKKLPVQIEQGRLVADGKHYDGHNIGFILIYPNPINPEKYVAVFSASSSKVMAKIPEAYSQMKSVEPADVGIFEVTDSGDIKWHIIERFNTVWRWHSHWKEVLTVAHKRHPKWRWCQWVARTLREQIEADAVICENPYKFSDSVLVGQVTYRDLSNTFRNDWIVKIKLDGKSLRDLLTVIFNDISKRKLGAVIVDGVSIVKPEIDSKGTILGINELEKDNKYMLACPHKIINGQRMGIAVKNYEIVGEGYLVPLLKDYLCKNKNLDIDAQLDSFKFNVF